MPLIVSIPAGNKPENQTIIKHQPRLKAVVFSNQFSSKRVPKSLIVAEPSWALRFCYNQNTLSVKIVERARLSRPNRKKSAFFSTPDPPRRSDRKTCRNRLRWERSLVSTYHTASFPCLADVPARAWPAAAGPHLPGSRSIRSFSLTLWRRIRLLGLGYAPDLT